MPIILARIDDRLIHGQITEGWCPKMKPEIILVVSDEVASSEWQGELCLAALPICFKGMVASVDEAHRIINELNEDPRSSYVLFESPEDANRAVKNGAQLTEINVGGMHSQKGKREILDYIFVDETDTVYLKSLRDRGIKLDFRDLPGHESIDVMSRL